MDPVKWRTSIKLFILIFQIILKRGLAAERCVLYPKEACPFYPDEVCPFYPEEACPFYPAFTLGGGVSFLPGPEEACPFYSE